MKKHNIILIFLFFNINIIIHTCEATRVAIIGGGVAGITAQTYLNDKGIKSIIFEKEDDIGGDAYTIKYNDNYYDLGTMLNSNLLPLSDEYNYLIKKAGNIKPEHSATMFYYHKNNSIFDRIPATLKHLNDTYLVKKLVDQYAYHACFYFKECGYVDMYDDTIHEPKVLKHLYTAFMDILSGDANYGILEENPTGSMHIAVQTLKQLNSVCNLPENTPPSLYNAVIKPSESEFLSHYDGFQNFLKRIIMTNEKRYSKIITSAKVERIRKGKNGKYIIRARGRTYKDFTHVIFTGANSDHYNLIDKDHQVFEYIKPRRSLSTLGSILVKSNDKECEFIGSKMLVTESEYYPGTSFINKDAVSFIYRPYDACVFLLGFSVIDDAKYIEQKNKILSRASAIFNTQLEEIVIRKFKYNVVPWTSKEEEASDMIKFWSAYENGKDGFIFFNRFTVGGWSQEIITGVPKVLDKIFQ